MENIERANIENTMNDIIMTYDTGIEEVNDYLNRANSTRTVVLDGFDERTINAVKIEKQRQYVYELSSNTLKKVQELINDYNNKEASFFSLKGSDITSDIDLLKLNLSVEQVHELQTRYKDNYTMLQAINEYSHNKGYPTYDIQTNRTDILDSFNKLIYPRYTENIQVPQQKLSFTFLDCATKYKDNFIKQVY